MTDDSAETFFQSFLPEVIVSSSGMGKRCPLFGVVHPAFPLQTTASPIVQGALKDGFGEAVLTRNVHVWPENAKTEVWEEHMDPSVIRKGLPPRTRHIALVESHEIYHCGREFAASSAIFFREVCQGTKMRDCQL